MTWMDIRNQKGPSHDSPFLPNDLARPQIRGVKVLDTLDTRFCSRCTVTPLASFPIFSFVRMDETRRKSIKANVEFWFLLFKLFWYGSCAIIE
jgi:hypothetical protein